MIDAVRRSSDSNRARVLSFVSASRSTYLYSGSAVAARGRAGAQAPKEAAAHRSKSSSALHAGGPTACRSCPRPVNWSRRCWRPGGANRRRRCRYAVAQRKPQRSWRGCKPEYIPVVVVTVKGLGRTGAGASTRRSCVGSCGRREQLSEGRHDRRYSGLSVRKGATPGACVVQHSPPPHDILSCSPNSVAPYDATLPPTSQAAAGRAPAGDRQMKRVEAERPLPSRRPARDQFAGVMILVSTGMSLAVKPT
jgi:hypothetical protein